MKNIYTKYASIVILLGSLLGFNTAHATAYVVWGTSVSLYTQSQAESTGNMIQSSKGILNGTTHPWCVNRMFIDSADKALYSAALGAWLSGKLVNIIYDDAYPGVYIAGHVSGLQCKVLSIF